MHQRQIIIQLAGTCPYAKFCIVRVWTARSFAVRTLPCTFPNLSSPATCVVNNTFICQKDWNSVVSFPMISLTFHISPTTRLCKFYLLNQGFSHFKMHLNRLGILLKCTFWLSRSQGLSKDCTFLTSFGVICHAAGPGTSPWVKRSSAILELSLCVHPWLLSWRCERNWGVDLWMSSWE